MRFSHFLPLAAAGAMFGLLPSVTCRGPFEPIDPQRILHSEGMTMDDYVPPPGSAWNDVTRKGSRTYKIALVTVDYEDQPFVISSQPGSTIFGNPQPIPAGMNISREAVPAFYRDLLTVPGDLNRGRTLHEYWMEDSGGGYGVELVEFGPYRMPHSSYQYGIDDTNPGACPAGSECGKKLDEDAKAAWRQDVGGAAVDGFEVTFILSAGQCEQQTRKAFGADKFASEQDVPDAFGPPRGASGQGSGLGNAAKSLTGWTSWASASRIWPEAIMKTTLSCEDAPLGTYVHEMSHVLSLKDNYPLPKDSVRRASHAGAYSPMNRGAFNGPGNTTWHIPSLEKGACPSAHTVHEKSLLFGLARARLPFFDHSSMESSGPVVVRIEARTASTDIIGLRVLLNSDRSPRCNQKADVLCDGGGYVGYDLEVIDRMGADSFQPDTGVMISKYRGPADKKESRQWVIDASAHASSRTGNAAAEPPSDASLKLPGALFHAGTRSGSLYEYVDEANALHFYVISRHRSQDGKLSYTVGVRSTARSGASVRGVTLGQGALPPAQPQDGPTNKGLLCTFDLTNNGTYVHGGGFRFYKKYYETDIYRLSATVQGAGWEVELPNTLAAAKFGETVKVEVAVKASQNAEDTGVVTLRARSESNPDVTDAAECRIPKRLS